jgi:AAA family ATP:ADP antiporter
VSGSGAHLARAAMTAAAFMMAHQVAAKAARDGLFLSQYPSSALPPMVITAAIASIGLGFLSSHLMSLWRPARVIPGLFAFSGAMHLGEWALFPLHPGPASIVVYVHAVGLGAVLLSGFWSLVNESFDPREAKKRFARIASAGTVGGILGGAGAERIAAMLTGSFVLLLLAALHLAAAALMTRIRPEGGAPADETSEQSSTTIQAFSKAPYLSKLAFLVFLTTSSAAVLDYLFKSQAAKSFAGGDALLRFFAVYYSSTAVLTFLMQTSVGRPALEALGLARTVASLPAAVFAGSVGALFAPRLAVMTIARGLESVLRGSLFRSGYELFYTPVPVAEKRSAKSVIDVAFDRLGDAAGGGIVQLILMTIPAMATNAILMICAGLAALGLWVARQLDRAYVQVLERGLLTRAVELDISQVEDVTTRSTLLRALQKRDQTMTVLPQVAPPQVEQTSSGYGLESVVQRLIDLRSGKADRVRAALEGMDRLRSLLVPQIIRLLAWDEVSPAARRVLASSAAKIQGQLIDAMLDPKEDFAVRRRIPRILAVVDSRLAVQGLIEGLKDPRFEVRFQCGRALYYILQRNPDFTVEPSAIFAAVEKELSVGKSVWQSHHLLDQREGAEDYLFLDEQLRERADQALEHVFSLLGLVLPREPLKVAFRALHTEDRLLRNLALEYLEGTLPESVRRQLWTVIGDQPLPEPGRPSHEVVSQLMNSSPNVNHRLRELHAERERRRE